MDRVVELKLNFNGGIHVGCRKMIGKAIFIKNVYLERIYIACQVNDG